MNRYEIIQIIGGDYLTANIEAGEYSYVQAAGSLVELEKLIGRKVSHYKLDIRFAKDDIVILIETKQKFTKKDEAQLAEYFYEERAVHHTKNIICILANTTNDKIKVWKSAVDDAHILKNETVLKNIDYYANLFVVNKQNDREKVLKNTYDLNVLLHKMDIKESLRSQFVGTTLLYIKKMVKQFAAAEIDNNLKDRLNEYWKMSSADEVRAAIKSTLDKLLDGSENKDKKVELLQQNVLNNQNVKNLSLKHWIEILNDILMNIYKYINMDSSEGQDILNLFFIAFNKYTGKADRNQAFTPDHITDFMCRLTGVDRSKIILDITCGSGSFLVQAMVKALADCRRNTTTAEAERLMRIVKTKHIYGIENEEKAYGLATTNMLIHGDGNSNIKFANCFDCEDFIINANPDIILMNPPYNAKPMTIPDKYKTNWGTSKDGKEDPTKGFVFIHYLSDIFKKHNDRLARDGRPQKTIKLAVLLPVSAAIGTSKIITDEKTAMLEDNTLEAVFTLPNEIFYPGSSVNACCMLFTLGKPHINFDGVANETFFGYYKDDGFVKKKNIGRVEQFDENGQSKWQTIERQWLDMFRNKKVVDGLSAMAVVTGNDEWLCEAYMKTDYSKLTEDDFQQTLNNYLAYLIKSGKKKRKLTAAPFLNVNNWKIFKISDIFHVKYGVNLELNACEEVEGDIPNSVNFVSRTSENNGISARVKIIDGIEPQKAGLISIAGGGSVLSTFLQNEPFYSGRDLYILKSKENISNETKLFIITVIEQNKLKYSYGRQANKTLQDIELKLPTTGDGKPDYQFMEDYIKALDCEPLTTNNESGQAPKLHVDNWKEFKISDLFKIENCKCNVAGNLDDGSDINYIGAKKSDNGVMRSVAMDSSLVSKGNGILFICDGEGSVGYTNYMDEDFIGSTTTAIGYNESINKYVAMFLVTILDMEKFKYSFGRKWKPHLKDTIIKLPATDNGEPDYQFMENYIKSLPYADAMSIGYNTIQYNTIQYN